MQTAGVGGMNEDMVILISSVLLIAMGTLEFYLDIRLALCFGMDGIKLLIDWQDNP
jgi:hypothetical protein